MNYNELTNEGNVRWSALSGGGIRLDVHTLASLQVLEVLTDQVDAETVDVNVLNANIIREGGVRVVDGGEVGGDRYFRLANGFQMCWTGTGYFTYSTAQALTYVWTYPAAFASGPVIKHPAIPTSGSNFEGGLNLNNIGTPFFASNPGLSSATCYLWNNSTNWSAGQAINSVRLVALGRWL